MARAQGKVFFIKEIWYVIKNMGRDETTMGRAKLSGISSS